MGGLNDKEPRFNSRSLVTRKSYCTEKAAWIFHRQTYRDLCDISRKCEVKYRQVREIVSVEKGRDMNDAAAVLWRAGDRGNVSRRRESRGTQLLSQKNRLSNVPSTRSVYQKSSVQPRSLCFCFFLLRPLASLSRPISLGSLNAHPFHFT